MPGSDGAFVDLEGPTDGLHGAAVGQECDDARDGCFVVATTVENRAGCGSEGLSAVATPEAIFFLAMEADVALSDLPMQRAVGIRACSFAWVHAALLCLIGVKSECSMDLFRSNATSTV